MTDELPNVSDLQELPCRMPFVYRLLFWLLIVDVFILTAWMWTAAARMWELMKADISISGTGFSILLLEYHIMLLLLTVFGQIMQTIWRTSGSSVVFPTVIVLCAVSLHMTAFQASILLETISG